MTPDVTQLTQPDADFAGRLRSAGNYAELTATVQEAGMPMDEDQLRAAFRQRNSRVIAPALIRSGLMPEQPIPTAPAWDQAKWDAVAALNLASVYRQLVN